MQDPPNRDTCTYLHIQIQISFTGSSLRLRCCWIPGFMVSGFRDYRVSVHIYNPTPEAPYRVPLWNEVPKAIIWMVFWDLLP